jgi:YidC/Oxa1 family membrane protein insertase
MDLQRSLLIGAIAVLSFMLLTEWVAFNDSKTATVAQETSRLMTDATEMPPTLPEPNLNTVAPAGEDIPAAPEQPSPETNPPTTTAESTGHIVQVYTDVIQLAIDLNGGDIVELSLPKFLAHLDNPKGPFVLLEDNEALVYVAQSGLIGPDGIDNNGRAKFTASAPRFILEEGEDTLVVDLKWQNDSESPNV